jgi:hypothetical protein
MRAIALAAIMSGTLFVGVAAAETWTDPNGRLVFEKPRGWQIDPQENSSATIVLAFDASHDCVLMASPNSVTAGATPRRVVNSTTAPFAASAWVTTASGISTLFPGGTAQVTSQTVETSGPWPVQRAELQSSQGTVYGAIQGRPGLDLMAFCAAYDSGTDVFNGLFNSMSHPSDAEWEAALAAAPAPAPTPAPAPAQ